MWSFPSESSGTNACTLFSYPMASLAIRKNTGIWHGIGELVAVQHDKIISRRKAHRSEMHSTLPNPHNFALPPSWRRLGTGPCFTQNLNIPPRNPAVDKCKRVDRPDLAGLDFVLVGTENPVEERSLASGSS